MRIYLVVLAVVLLSACVRNKSGQVEQVQTATPVNVFEVAEVLQTSSYTYLRVKENLEEKWVATTKAEAKAGDVLYYDEIMQMTNFESKELGRTFDVIYFVNRVSASPFEENKMDFSAGHSGKPDMGQSQISMEKREGELTIKEVFANKEKYANEVFEIKGIAVKVVPQVMGKNWIHIQDGTSHDGEFDLTITTKEDIQENSEVHFKGKLTLDKDFGYGYFYKVIMEDADQMVEM